MWYFTGYLSQAHVGNNYQGKYFENILKYNIVLQWSWIFSLLINITMHFLAFESISHWINEARVYTMSIVHWNFICTHLQNFIWKSLFCFSAWSLHCTATIGFSDLKSDQLVNLGWHKHIKLFNLILQLFNLITVF